MRKKRVSRAEATKVEESDSSDLELTDMKEGALKTSPGKSSRWKYRRNYFIKKISLYSRSLIFFVR